MRTGGFADGVPWLRAYEPLPYLFYLFDENRLRSIAIFNIATVAVYSNIL
jgi:hypothetical protein